jgi:hypothetical protein
VPQHAGVKENLPVYAELFRWGAIGAANVEVQPAALETVGQRD